MGRCNSFLCWVAGVREEHRGLRASESSLDALAALGKRLYALALLPDQARVAWSHYQVRKTALEQVVTLGPPARALLARVGRATPQSLPQLGARLYRLQHGGAVPIAPTEWRRIWSAYRGRRAPSA